MVESSLEHDGPSFEAALTAAVAELRGYARRWTNDWPSADDLVQQAAERALRARNSFAPGTNARAWLRKIIRNLAIDEIRRKSHLRKVEVSSEQAGEVPDSVVVDAEPPGSLLPDIDEVRRAAEQLGEPWRTIFLLRLDEDLSYKELSERTGRPIGTIGSSLGRARTLIRGIVRHGSIAYDGSSARRMRRKCKR